MPASASGCHSSSSTLSDALSPRLYRPIVQLDLWLGVWERNARARAFYSRWGFTEVGEMHFVLGNDPQRDLVLALAL